VDGQKKEHGLRLWLNLWCSREERERDWAGVGWIRAVLTISMLGSTRQSLTNCQNAIDANNSGKRGTKVLTSVVTEDQ
jgi:hypothetical protein